MTRWRRGVGMAMMGLAVAPSMVGCGGHSSPIDQIMTKLAKGPNSLTPTLGKELKEAQPPWETIQGQAKEYVLLTAELGKHQPPKGTSDSWAKLTGEYAESALELDKAAQAKDKDAALAAHSELALSCKSCHQAHRGGGPGMGGPPGGFPGGPPSGRPPE